jgi:hypothetical protein
MWSADPGLADPSLFDPVGDVPFRISREDRIVTAGSCFAQHVSRHLARAGFRHHVTEAAHPVFDADLARRFSYGVFSARYGNVYTARQLLQLLQRAYGLFTPLASSWPQGEGARVVDPFRPRIQPEGFLSGAELATDREVHLAAVRRAVEEVDVFVFTLGLTEAWEDPRDGAVFPLAPGVSGGTWRPEAARFRNFDEDETWEDLRDALALIRERNPAVRVILTVSPVSLAATFEPRHVVVSTAWSKACLRIAAERAARRIPGVMYFPSYEVITSPQARGRYWAENGRDVREEGVEHVMRLFLRHVAGVEPGDVPTAPDAPAPQDLSEMERAIEVLCDEQAITNR